MEKLTERLTIKSVNENNYKDGKLTAVVCYFDFFGEEGSAHILMSKIDGKYPSYGITEIDEALSDSFNQQLEEDDVWAQITESVKKYAAKWELENAEN